MAALPVMVKFLVVVAVGPPYWRVAAPMVIAPVPKAPTPFVEMSSTRKRPWLRVMFAVLPILVRRIVPGPLFTKVCVPLGAEADKMMPASRSMPEGVVPAATVMVIELPESFWIRELPEPIHVAVVGLALTVIPA